MKDYRSKDWIMPSQYWHRRVQYTDFSAHFFFLDSNFIDANDMSPYHLICQGNPNFDCWGISLGSCRDWLNKAWQSSKDMVAAELNKARNHKNEAEWHILVTHFPAPMVFSDPFFQNLNAEYGIDLIVTGHTHMQMTGVDDNTGMHWIITGGGGGVTSDAGPVGNGQDDAYGFVDFTINASFLKWDMHSWGGGRGEGPPIIRRTVTVQSHKRRKQSQDKLEPMEEVEV